MGKDLWSFKTAKDLERQTKDLPDTILKEQIMLGKSFEDDCSFFEPDYVSNDKNEFENTIKEILASDKILNIIQMLFSKAAMISS